MGISRRALSFGRGKRVPSDDDCAENTLLRITNPSISAYRQKQPESPTRAINTNNALESGGEDDSRDNNVEQAESSSIDNLASDVKKTAVKRKAGTFWNTDEAMIFYDAIKEHGKNFDQIVALLSRKKFNKDKDQIRNFFYNTFKITKDKITIAEQDWMHVPQLAKELLIVINALEWRKRTHTTNINAVKFKNLLMTGSTTIKIPGKRIPISIRTPNCTALHKFFPSLKQSAKLPSTIKVQLVPNTYASRKYVLSCEQNPLLTIAVNTQSPVSTLFRFIEQKWQRNSEQKTGTESNDQQPPVPILYPPEGFKASKIVVHSADDAHPSVKSIVMRANESKISSASNTPTTSKNESASTPKNLSNTFELLEEQLTNGLTAENALNTSFLHFYYLFNQQSTIRLRYDLITNVRSSNVFVKLSELIRNSEGIIDVKNKKRPSTAGSTPQFACPQPINQAMISNAPKRLPNFRMANEDIVGTEVVDNERDLFKQQLVALRQKSKNPQKIGKTTDGPANKRMCKNAATPPQTTVIQPVASSSAHDSNLEETQDSFGFTQLRHKNSSTTTATQNGKTFTNLQPLQNSSQEPVFEDVVNNETRSSLLPSPLKALHDAKSLSNDMYRYFESMASQSSNDVCANFKSLVESMGNESSQSALE